MESTVNIAFATENRNISAREEREELYKHIL
jgi:hypothetical protein